ncbi:MAG: DUF4127 family protein [Phascolarctobacterium sp.]
MKKIFLIFITVLLLALYYTLNLSLPTTKEVHFPQNNIKENILLVPLDSRPVCSTMVQKLGRIVGLNVIVPPKELLDNYRHPANRKKLYEWLNNNISHYQKAIISADILLHGSLLQSRQTTVTPKEQQKFLQGLQKLRQENGMHTAIDIFSIIPRLLVSDELLPDRWYQFHLMRYSQLLDMTEINNDPYMTKELLEYQNKIPNNILAKYLALFKNSHQFNLALLEAAKKQQSQVPFNIIIGQDDASPFGLPHRNALQLQKFMQHEKLQHHTSITYGADEIASLLLTRYYLQQQKWQPKVYLQFATPNTEFMHMPYMAVSTDAAIRNQLQFVGAAITDDYQAADVILYIHCGDEKHLPQKQQVQAISNILAQNKRLALVDLSANFNAEEMLLPYLLDEKVPVNHLCAYAGWNTFSNSSGTAIAQSLLFTGRLYELQKAKSEPQQIAALYAQNLQFTIERMVEDYYYQKKLHPQLRPYLESFGITPTDLMPDAKEQTEFSLQKKISLYSCYLLHSNLGRTPFYEDKHNAYYLRDLAIGVRLPWNRIFEVSLDVHTHTGRKN